MFIEYKDKIYTLLEKKVVGKKSRTMEFELYAELDETTRIKVATYTPDFWLDIHAIHGAVSEVMLVDILKYDIYENIAKYYGHAPIVNPNRAVKSITLTRTSGKPSIDIVYSN